MWGAHSNHDPRRDPFPDRNDAGHPDPAAGGAGGMGSAIMRSVTESVAREQLHAALKERVKDELAGKLKSKVEEEVGLRWLRISERERMPYRRPGRGPAWAVNRRAAIRAAALPDAPGAARVAVAAPLQTAAAGARRSAGFGGRHRWHPLLRRAEAETRMAYLLE